MHGSVWHQVSKITQQRKWQNGKWTRGLGSGAPAPASSSSLPPTRSASLDSPYVVSVLDSWDDELKWGQEAGRTGWRQKDVMESTVWFGLDEEWWFMISLSAAWAPLLPCARVLSDAELRGSAVCLALGRGIRSDSFHVSLDVWDIWKAFIWTE